MLRGVTGAVSKPHQGGTLVRAYIVATYSGRPVLLRMCTSVGDVGLAHLGISVRYQVRVGEGHALPVL